MELADGFRLIIAALADVWTPIIRRTTSEWADAHRVLTGKSASEPGQWRTDRMPHLREIQDCLSDHHPATDITMCTASQVGKTEVILNWVGQTIHETPAPMMVVQPTIDMGERFSKQRIAPMIDACDVLKERVPPPRAKDGGNSVLIKDLKDMVLIISGANSPAGLAMMPIKKLALDEVDRYPQEVGEEGSPVEVAKQRTANFPRAKRLLCSTPTTIEASIIWREYLLSSQAERYVPCPHCHEMQVLRRENLKWSEYTDKDTGEVRQNFHDAHFVCVSCGEKIEHWHKDLILPRGEFRHKFEHLKNRRPGYLLSGYYSPIGLGRTWAEIAEKLHEARQDPVKMKTYTNLIDGLPYEEHADRVKGADLSLRAEELPIKVVPKGYYILTAGVDVQNDRLEMHVMAWGPNERRITIDYLVIDADDPWNALDAARKAVFLNHAGIEMKISMTAIDSGYRTHEVYNYCRVRQSDGVMAIKGSKMIGRPILGRQSRIDVKTDGKVLPGAVRLWEVGTDTAKDDLFARIDADSEIHDPTLRGVRYPCGLPDSFFCGIMSEVKNRKTGRYIKVEVRNEPLDTAVYAHAAACHPSVRVHRMADIDWALLAEMFEPVVESKAESEEVRSSDDFIGDVDGDWLR